MCQDAYIVQIGLGCTAWFLCGSYWTAKPDWASCFDSPRAARDALEAARPFTDPEMFTQARTVQAAAMLELARAAARFGGAR